MKSARSGSPLIDRIAAKLGCSKWEAKRLKRAFVEALREEVEARYPALFTGNSDLNDYQPLVIAGLGSFRMVERESRMYPNPPWREEQQAGGPGEGDLPLSSTLYKPPARKLAFRAKWEPIR